MYPARIKRTGPHLVGSLRTAWSKEIRIKIVSERVLRIPLEFEIFGITMDFSNRVLITKLAINVVDVMRRRNVDGSGLDVHGSGSGSGVVYHGVEATVVVGGVLHSPDGAVGFVEGVRALHDITVAGLLLETCCHRVGYDGSGVVGDWSGGSVVGDSGSGVVGDGRGGVVGDCWGSDGYALGWLVMTYNVLGRHGSS
ncbi:hypothetical protein HW555_013534 [Spodoptera exigua]|uniref:Uncharacterized protein n=1 Tax=Spodoptera exigua TaxID=7107 RepID=A0A835G4Y3_SPOEX|nr:hypothetical protein HW555_013534 [Spodoptera exigua]